MKKGNVLIIACVVAIIIMIAFAFVMSAEKRVEQLQAALRKNHQHLANAENHLTEASNKQRQLEYQNQQLVCYIEAKEALENREPIGFKIK